MVVWHNNCQPIGASSLTPQALPISVQSLSSSLCWVFSWPRIVTAGGLWRLPFLPLCCRGAITQCGSPNSASTISRSTISSALYPPHLSWWSGVHRFWPVWLFGRCASAGVSARSLRVLSLLRRVSQQASASSLQLQARRCSTLVARRVAQ